MSAKRLELFLRTIFSGLLVCPIPAGAETPSAQEVQLRSLIETNGAQLRTTMVWDERLHLVARSKARDMAERSYSNHVDPDGYAANHVCRLAGYGVPHWYPTDIGSNNVESLAFGYLTANAVVTAWIGSGFHKEHVFANPIDGFFSDQTRFAVGYWHDAASTHKHYWVFLSIHPDGASEEVTGDVEWMFDRMSPLMMDDAGGDADGDGTHQLLEYVFEMDPCARDQTPPLTPVRDPASGKLSLTVPIREDLDTAVTVAVETTTNLATGGWTTNGVTQSGDIFSAGGPGDSKRFLRVKATKP